MSEPRETAGAIRHIEVLEALRRVEKEQALVYRAMAASAEDIESDLAQRFHDLHADEQHHLSRLTARVLELGGRPVDLSALRVDAPNLQRWRETVRDREAVEIAGYREALEVGFDAATQSLLNEILAVEEHHSSDLGGKWTMA